MEDELKILEARRDALTKQRNDASRKKALKQEIFKLEHPVQAKVGNAVLNIFKPTPGSAVSGKARKAKLKRKIATVSDVDKALSGLLKM